MDPVAGREKGTGDQHQFRPVIAASEPGSHRDEDRGHAEKYELFEFHVIGLLREPPLNNEQVTCQPPMGRAACICMLSALQSATEQSPVVSFCNARSNGATLHPTGNRPMVDFGNWHGNCIKAGNHVFKPDQTE